MNVNFIKDDQQKTLDCFQTGNFVEIQGRLILLLSFEAEGVVRVFDFTENTFDCWAEDTLCNPVDDRNIDITVRR